MTEQSPGGPRSEGGSGAPDGIDEEPVATGDPRVDSVLADVEHVDELPLEDQLAAFERAHEQLRSALDSDPGEPA
jgi:hypothetical protein